MKHLTSWRKFITPLDTIEKRLKKLKGINKKNSVQKAFYFFAVERVETIECILKKLKFQPLTHQS